MIFVDTSELKSNSKTAMYLPERYKGITGLEQWTGGDVMISVADLPDPKTEALARLHIKYGAIVVQIKHGHDLSSSVGQRLDEEQARMHEAGCKPWQTVLLFCGFLNRDDNGYALIDNHKVHGGMTWASVQSALDWWAYRNGVPFSINNSKMLPAWLNLQEAHLAKAMKNGDKYVFPERPIMYAGGGDFDPLQPLRKIDDFRVTLLTVPRLGEKRVNNLYQWMAVNGKKLTLRSAIECLVTEHERIIKEVPMWGKGTVQSVWEWYDRESNVITIQAMERDND